MDPQGNGSVPPDAFVPLMFWLGLTRRRSAALTTMELAFGPGDVDVAAISHLGQYVEVQVRLIDGFRQLARVQSLDQLCEFMTDWSRLREWFYSMRRDPTGHVDVVEVQNLLARMEVTSDRATLFRFLSFVARSGTMPGSKGRQGTLERRTLGIEDFASLICRCAIAWCLHRTLQLITCTAAPSTTTLGAPTPQPQQHQAQTTQHKTQSTKSQQDGHDSAMSAKAPSPATPLGVKGSVSANEVGTAGHEVDEHTAKLRWTQLQRKIAVSLLVNHRFWGRESRSVLASLHQPDIAMREELAPELWLSLFQRVRAQGLASTLPVGQEFEDPGFLRKKAEHARIGPGSGG